MSDYARSMSTDGYSKRTIRSRQNVVRLFADAARVAPHELRREHVADYLAERELSASTRTWYLAMLEPWGVFAGIDGLTDGIRRPPVPRRVPRPISEPALTRLLMATAPGSRARTFIVLGAWAGLRSVETATLLADDLVEETDGWMLTIRGKGGVRARVHVPPIVVEHLRPWIAAAGGRGRLWPTATPGSVQQAIYRAAAAAGVRCSSHQLRHRYGTAFYRESKDLLLTQQVMRHASPSTTAGYALVVADQAAAVVARLPGAARAVGGIGA